MTAAADPAAAARAAVRHRRIAESAYLRAAARGFAGDGALDDWLAAEQEIDAGTVGCGQGGPAPASGSGR